MPYILGLDLGARSLGWALIDAEKHCDNALVATGVRIFEAGVSGDIERGREESKAAGRRMARNSRRQTRRRRQRRVAVYRLLASKGFLPQVDHGPGRPEAVGIQSALEELDRELRAKHQHEGRVQELPYLLRAKGASGELTEQEFGRTIYHLAQRRGFQSNRKMSKAASDETGVVYEGIRIIREELDGRTLGAFLADSNPHERRYRARYTHRQMYRDEFATIWEKQSRYFPSLTEEFKKELERLLFDQRPLKGGEDLVGPCDLEQGERRAPIWNLSFQTFRILQAVNHLRVQDPGGREVALNASERDKLAAALETAKELTFKQAKKLLGLRPELKFSLEAGKETKFRGNTVAARFRALEPDIWDEWSVDQRENCLKSIDRASDDEEVALVMRETAGLCKARATEFSENFHLPTGYGALSIKAIKNLLPHMRQGLSVQEAKLAAKYDIVKRMPLLDLLPPIKDTKLSINNPAVSRALTETRKVVNAVIRKWGKPDEIHIEVARDLKKNREARAEASRVNSSRENLRDQMRDRIAKEIGIPDPTRKDIEKGLLWDECCGMCPYTGESLGSFTSLFGPNCRAQVEHVIPRSRSLDDSFENLTLASFDANRIKANRTPYEAFHRDDEAWEQILQRVKSFKGEYARKKLKRFQIDESDTAKLLAQFSERQLQDTRYASIVAADYLGHLYGGRIADGKTRIFTYAGQITAELRRLWRIPAIGGMGPRKSRDFHFHHAVDAIVIALANDGWVKKLSDAAQRAWAEKKRGYASVAPPWDGFIEDISRAVSEIRVSHRPDRRVSGALHKKTFFSVAKGSKEGMVRVRIDVNKDLKESDIKLIADPGVRAAVEKKVQEAGGIKKLLESDPPVLPNRKGEPIPIRRVRVEFPNAAWRPIGKGHKERFAEGSEMHHVALYEVEKVTKGKVTRIWDSEVVPQAEAMRRCEAGQPVVDRAPKPGREFLFSICKRDVLELNDPKGERTGIWLVNTLYANKQIFLVDLSDARPKKESFSLKPSTLQPMKARKMNVGVLGDLHPAK
jgi:CRISPR-associated endonuclease Csn1